MALSLNGIEERDNSANCLKGSLTFCFIVFDRSRMKHYWFHEHTNRTYVCQNGNSKLSLIFSVLTLSSHFLYHFLRHSPIAIWQRKFDFNVNLLTWNIPKRMKCDCCNHRIEVNNIILCLCLCSISNFMSSLLRFPIPLFHSFACHSFELNMYTYWIVATKIVAFSIWPNICLVERWRYWVFISNKRIRIQMLSLASSLSI